MKLKKLVSAVACVVMAGVFATSAFAATPDQMKDAREYLAKKQISYDISEDEVDLILKISTTRLMPKLPVML